MALKAVDTPSPAWKELVKNFRYVAGEYGHPDTFDALKTVLDEADKNLGTAGNRIFYLATIPDLFGTVATALGQHGCATPGPEGSFARLLVEKPFGRDLASALALDATLHDAFDESQIFRIDHYMGKETVQNVLALRFANAIFEPVWNRRYIDNVQITVAEELGVEHRGGFYETAGALRDIVQNHVMQVLALTLMEPPAQIEAQSIRDEKVKLLQAVVIPSVDEAVGAAVRAQYTAGTVGGVAVPAYREEPDVDPHSRTETFVAMKLSVDNWRWAGVPVYIRTGKRLPKRSTEVTLQFHRAPHLAFGSTLSRDLLPNSLVLRIQPDDGICLRFGAKVPGEAFRVRSVGMDFSYAETFPGPATDGYERLLHDAMVGDATLFIRDRRGRAGLEDRRSLPRGLVARRGSPWPTTRPAPGARARRSCCWPTTSAAGATREPRRTEHRTGHGRRGRGPRLRRHAWSTPSPGASNRASPWCCRADPRPARCYEALADEGAASVDWSVVDVLMGDERCVPADDPDANQRLVRESLLDRVGAVSAIPPHGLRGGRRLRPPAGLDPGPRPRPPRARP